MKQQLPQEVSSTQVIKGKVLNKRQNAKVFQTTLSSIKAMKGIFLIVNFT